MLTRRGRSRRSRRPGDDPLLAAPGTCTSARITCWTGCGRAWRTSWRGARGGHGGLARSPGGHPGEGTAACVRCCPRSTCCSSTSRRTRRSTLGCTLVVVKRGAHGAIARSGRQGVRARPPSRRSTPQAPATASAPDSSQAGSGGWRRRQPAAGLRVRRALDAEARWHDRPADPGRGEASRDPVRRRQPVGRPRRRRRRARAPARSIGPPASSSPEARA